MKQQIIDYLVENGFSATLIENQYIKKVRTAAGEAVVNGEHHVEYKIVELKFEFIGDGWEGKSEEDNQPLTQWKYFQKNLKLKDKKQIAKLYYKNNIQHLSYTSILINFLKQKQNL